MIWKNTGMGKIQGQYQASMEMEEGVLEIAGRKEISIG